MFKLATHSGKLERWLGKEQIDNISRSMRGTSPETRWYGKPIALAGVPGRVYVGRDGDFRGRILSGLEASALDVIESFRRRFKTAAQEQAFQLNSGFSSIASLIAAARTVGKKRQFQIYKVGTAGITSGTNSLWLVGSYPAAGASPAGAPGGRAPDSTTAGALPFVNPASGTQHFVSAYLGVNTANMSLLLYDRIFDVAKTMNSTATEAVTGVPTRYTSTTGGNADSAENNFLFVECSTVLPATAHNWATVLYTNHAGTTGQTLPSLTGNSSNIVNRIDHPIGQWFAPLAAGDTGISALTQMQCSATIATGAINFVMGHPIAFFGCPELSLILTFDGVGTAFNFERVFDSACLAFLEPIKTSGTATTYQGTLATVAN